MDAQEEDSIDTQLQSDFATEREGLLGEAQQKTAEARKGKGIASRANNLQDMKAKENLTDRAEGAWPMTPRPEATRKREETGSVEEKHKEQEYEWLKNMRDGKGK